MDEGRKSSGIAAREYKPKLKRKYEIFGALRAIYRIIETYSRENIWISYL